MRAFSAPDLARVSKPNVPEDLPGRDPLGHSLQIPWIAERNDAKMTGTAKTAIAGHFPERRNAIIIFKNRPV
jgi:hypothetical protein